MKKRNFITGLVFFLLIFLGNQAFSDSKNTIGPADKPNPVEQSTGDNKTPDNKLQWEPNVAIPVLNWLKETSEHIIGEVAGFAIFSIIVSFALRRHLVEALKDGAKNIAESQSTTFIQYVLPELKKVREKAEEVISGVGGNVLHHPPAITASKAVENDLDKIKELKLEGKFDDAEIALTELRKKYPEEFKILSELYYLHTERKWARERKEVAALKIVKAAEEEFKRDHRYYDLLTRAFINAREKISTAEARDGAVKAIKKALEINPNNARYMNLLGLVHYSFNNISAALEVNMRALELALDQKDDEVVSYIKNNMAFYYAMEADLKNKEIALRYAEEAYEYDKSHNAANRINSMDTLGFVKMQYATNRKEFLEARDLLTQAVADAPDDEDLQLHLRMVIEQLQNYP